MEFAPALVQPCLTHVILVLALLRIKFCLQKEVTNHSHSLIV